MAQKKVILLTTLCTLLFGRALHSYGDFGVGVGFYDAGTHHSGGCVQLEYKWDYYLWGRIRPQMGLLTAQFSSLFLYGGIGLEWQWGPFIVRPNFAPGLYWQGCGRNLGFPIEFRSGIDFAYSIYEYAEAGMTIAHISNASLGKHNPGANMLIFYLAFPFCELLRPFRH